MMKRFIAILLICTSLNVYAEKTACDKLPDDWLITRDIDISAIEKTSLERLREYKDIPQVPFGRLNKKWEDLKSKVTSSRELVKFTSPPATWRGLAGREGYAVLEDGCIVDLIIIRLS